MIFRRSMRHIKVARNLRNRQAVMLKKKLEDLNGVIVQLALWASPIKLLFKLFYLLSKLCILRLQSRFLMFQRRNLVRQQRDLFLQDGELTRRAHHEAFKFDIIRQGPTSFGAEYHILLAAIHGARQAAPYKIFDAESRK